MTPLQAAAQFAAFTWFADSPEHAGKSKADAHQFARTNWEQFLACADEGFGRLLLRLARPKKVRTRRVRSVRLAGSAA